MEVELAAMEGGGNNPEQPAAAAVCLEPNLEAGLELGPYRTVRLLGAGGTGRVYLAERVEFAQRVAVKCFFVDLGWDGAANLGPDGAARERDSLSLLDHPHIVRLIDQGTTADGTRYLAMEYVDGLPLDAYADTRRLTVEARVRLMLPVLEAVEYAHRHLIVHCDLKPANVLVTADGQPKLLDFGASARLEAGQQSAGMTRVYASPEQQMGGLVTVASDVYTLGLLLRQVLAGQGPEVSRDTPLMEFRWMGEMQTTAFRERLRQLVEVRSTTLERLERSLRGDLDAIVRKAVAERAEDRYGTVAAMRVDLERHLEGLPIAARTTGRVERVSLWGRRHKLAAAMVAVLVVAVGGSAGGVAWKAAEAREERRVAETRLEDLVRMNGSLEGELYSSVAKLPGAEAARQSLLAGASATLERVHAAGSQDPRLAVDLAMQFEQVARLQASAGDYAAARRSAAKGLAMLRGGQGAKAGEAEAVRLRALLAELR